VARDLSLHVLGSMGADLSTILQGFIAYQIKRCCKTVRRAIVCSQPRTLPTLPQQSMQSWQYNVVDSIDDTVDEKITTVSQYRRCGE
jgi:hypothetical protein